MNFYQQRLSHFRNLGFYPKVIYDIGASKGEWSNEAEEIFPNSHFYLFEANQKNIHFLEKQKHPFFIELLGDQEKPTVFYTTEKEGCGTGDSIFKENTTLYSEKYCKEIMLPMKTLSSVVKQYQIPSPDLIKIDVQGSEKLVIQGGTEIILSAQAVILEIQILHYNQGSSLLAEIVALMDNLGFQIVDLLQAQYIFDKYLMCLEGLFIKKDSKFICTGILF